MFNFLQSFGLIAEEDPKELCRKLQRDLRQGQRELARELRHLDRQEQLLIGEIRRFSKEGQYPALHISARNLAKLHQTKEKVAATRLKLKDVSLQVRQQLALLYGNKARAEVARVLQDVNSILSSSGLARTVQEWDKQQIKQQIILTTLEDTLDLDELEDQEVEKLVDEIVRDDAKGISRTTKLASSGKELLQRAYSTGDIAKLPSVPAENQVPKSEMLYDGNTALAG